MIDVEAALKAFIIYQPEEVSILSGRGEIPRLHRLSSEYPDDRKANQSRT